VDSIRARVHFLRASAGGKEKKKKTKKSGRIGDPGMAVE
jgi:hypothetical protein